VLGCRRVQRFLLSSIRFASHRIASHRIASHHLPSLLFVRNKFNFKSNTQNVLFLFITFRAFTPQVIRNVAELQAMKNDLDGTYELANDIDACETATWNSGKGFEPVGNGFIWHQPNNCFTGTFNGNGHKITGLTINRPDEDEVGLFGCAIGRSIDPEFRDVGVVDANIIGKNFVGALAGRLFDAYNYRLSASRCFSSGKIDGGAYSGGLFGSLYDLEIEDCFSTADVKGYGPGPGPSDAAAGGLVGTGAYSIIRNSYATGAVQGTVSAGGLVGRIAGSSNRPAKELYCFATGPVTVTAETGILGLGGLNGSGGSISNIQAGTSYWYAHPDGDAVSGVGAGGVLPQHVPDKVQYVSVFYDNAKEPLTEWDFVGVWLFQNQLGEDYPILQRETPIAVPLDVKPGSCPNPLNRKSKGVLPAAILGTNCFDVGKLDPDTIVLYVDNEVDSIRPIRYALEDVATPYEPFLDKPLSLNSCTTGGRDGKQDLTMKFDTQQLVALLSDVDIPDDGLIKVFVKGKTKSEYGSHEILGEEVMKLVGKK
jgi:hypothetical protein